MNTLLIVLGFAAVGWAMLCCILYGTWDAKVRHPYRDDIPDHWSAN